MSHTLAPNEIYKYSKPINLDLKPLVANYTLNNISNTVELEIHNGKVLKDLVWYDFLDIQYEHELLKITTLKPNSKILIIKYTGNISQQVLFNIRHDWYIIEEIYTSNTIIQTQYNICENTKLTHHMIHAKLDGHSSYIGRANIASNATYISNILNIDCNYLHINLTINLNGQNGRCENKILNYAINSNNLDVLMLINHNESHTNSNTLAHAIAQDDACSSILGKIYVSGGIKQINSNLQIKNLVDSKSATCNSRPQLEIYSDDIKCSHGSTTGSLNNEAIYYMQTRGIEPKLAKQLLRMAFINHIVENIDIIELKDQIYTLLNLDAL